MELAEPGIKLEVIEHVVHPAHVPFQVETETAYVGGLGHHRPGGGFLRDREGTGEVLEQHMVGLLEEAHRLGVLAAAVFIRQPFPIGP